MDFWQRYRAIDARDTRFDGQFYTAVRTTGIYCRPSCPARTPKAENVTFYETSAAAHDAGYRACKRCLPEAVPGTPAWNIRSDIAGRAMRLINDGVINRDGVEGLASRLGYSSRQLNRILSHELGAGPLSLARASRAQTARTLLVSTPMKLADIAFAAGFSSVRQFNETIGEVFAMTPTALRATARHHRAPAATTALTLSLPYREPFDPGIFDFLAVRSIPGIETGTATSYARTLRLPHADARFRVEYDGGAPGRPLVLTIGAVDLRDLPSLLSRVRRLLDLDADPVAIDSALAADARLAPAVKALPGMRMPGAVDPQELLVRAMIGQQITVAAARTALTQLSGCGSESLVPADGLHRLFPTAAQIADPGFGLLRGPQRRIDSVRTAAVRHGLRGPGFRLRRRPRRAASQAAPAGRGGTVDRGIRCHAGDRGPGRVPGQRRRGAERDPCPRRCNTGRARAARRTHPDFTEVRPWRSYATMHLWRAAARAPSPDPSSR